jgi:Na+(H+)/acetate symporter ActP
VTLFLFVSRIKREAVSAPNAAVLWLAALLCVQDVEIYMDYWTEVEYSLATFLVVLIRPALRKLGQYLKIYHNRFLPSS